MNRWANHAGRWRVRPVRFRNRDRNDKKRLLRPDGLHHGRARAILLFAQPAWPAQLELGYDQPRENKESYARARVDNGRGKNRDRKPTPARAGGLTAAKYRSCVRRSSSETLSSCPEGIDRRPSDRPLPPVRLPPFPPA